MLIADDEEMIRIFAKAALEHFGYTVTLAGNGLEAVDLFAHAPNAFDLVLLDLTMPAMNGEEVFRRLQILRPGVPVLLFERLQRDLGRPPFRGPEAGWIPPEALFRPRPG